MGLGWPRKVGLARKKGESRTEEAGKVNMGSAAPARRAERTGLCRAAPVEGGVVQPLHEGRSGPADEQRPAQPEQRQQPE